MPSGPRLGAVLGADVLQVTLSNLHIVVLIVIEGELISLAVITDPRSKVYSPGGILARNKDGFWLGSSAKDA